jgi:hypothetical protein
MNVIRIKEPFKPEYIASREEAAKLYNSSPHASEIMGWRVGMNEWIPLEKVLFGENKGKDVLPRFKQDTEIVTSSEKSQETLIKTNYYKKESWLSPRNMILILLAALVILALLYLNYFGYFKTDPNQIEYHYPNPDYQKITHFDGRELSSDESEQLTKYEEKIRDFVYSRWELPTHPERHWKYSITAEVDKDGYVKIIGLDWFGPIETQGELLKVLATEMGKSVDQITMHTHYNKEGNYFKYPLPSFIRDTIPSWNESDFKLPIKLELNSEVIYKMKKLPKTQYRDSSLWKQYTSE